MWCIFRDSMTFSALDANGNFERILKCVDHDDNAYFEQANILSDQICFNSLLYRGYGQGARCPDAYPH